MRIARQRRARAAVTRQHMQHALGQTGQLEQTRNREAAAHCRARVRFQHHRVAERQRGRDRAHRQVEREVEWRDHADYAERASACERQAPRRRRQHFARRARRQAARFMERLDGHRGLKACFDLGRPAFANDPFRDFMEMRFGDLRRAAQHGRALVVRRRRPRQLRARRARRRLRDQRRVGHSDASEALAGRRLQDVRFAAAGAPVAGVKTCLPDVAVE